MARYNGGMSELDTPPDAETEEREALRRAVAEARAAAERGELVDHEVVAAWLDDLARGVRRPAPKPR
jgi:predicted transcriptional regulator